MKVNGVDVVETRNTSTGEQIKWIDLNGQRIFAGIPKLVSVTIPGYEDYEECHDEESIDYGEGSGGYGGASICSAGSEIDIVPGGWRRTLKVSVTANRKGQNVLRFFAEADKQYEWKINFFTNTVVCLYEDGTEINLPINNISRMPNQAYNESYSGF